MSALKVDDVKTMADLNKRVNKAYKENRKKDCRTPKSWWSVEVDEAWKQKAGARKKFNVCLTRKICSTIRRKPLYF